MPLDDERWRQLNGAYRVAYDPSVAPKMLETGVDVWGELWDHLHHQGDVDVASYAAVPHLVRIAQSASRRDWNVYALVALIEAERHRKANPPVPEWLNEDCEMAWEGIVRLGLQDLGDKVKPPTLQSILSVLALARGDRKLGTMLLHLASSEIDELVEEHLSWSELYG